MIITGLTTTHYSLNGITRKLYDLMLRTLNSLILLIRFNKKSSKNFIRLDVLEIRGQYKYISNNLLNNTIIIIGYLILITYKLCQTLSCL